MSELSDQKKQLRFEMKLRRSSHSDLPAVSKTMWREWLDTHPQAQVLAIFAALPQEPDLLSVIADFPELTWVLPKVDGDSLRFFAVSDVETQLSLGAFGIREPNQLSTEIDVARIDTFFCPGIAFDHKGGRLGRGRGFYDRVLEKAQANALKVGVTFAFQLVETTFSEAHDIRMDELWRL